MTWGEIKIITLQKMFAKDEPISTKNLAELINDDDCKVYLANMSAPANEAIQRLASYCENKYEYNEEKGKYEKKKHTIIRNNTSNDFVIELPDSATSLIPLYIASQLYKDDDIAQATAYRNEFEAGLVDLVNEIENPHEIVNIWEV